MEIMRLLIFSLALAGVSFAVSAAAVRLGISIASGFGFVAHPNPIVQNHTRPVALGGGISFGAVLLCLVCILCILGLIPWRIPLAFSPLLLLGAVDDLVRLPPGKKLLLQGAAILPYLLAADMPWWSLPWIGLFLLSSMNAWNLIDIMDGLLGWISMICFLGIACSIYCLEGKIEPPALIATVAAGTIGGFLFWNTYPAKVYMGDAGSLALGMVFGTLVAEEAFFRPKLGLCLLLIGTIPFFEMLFLIIVRTRKGIPFYRGSPDHFALRLLHQGRSVPWIVQRVILIALVLSVLGVITVLEGMSWPMLGISWILTLIAASFAFRKLLGMPVWDNPS